MHVPAVTSRRTARRLIAGLAAGLALVLVAPASASASPDTLQRALANLAFGPLDIVLSPVVALTTEIENIRNVSDTRAVQIAYAVPGFFWLTGVQAGAGALRIGTGFVELVPGVVLLAFPDADLDPLFDPVARGSALVELENPLNDEPSWLGYFPPTLPVTLDVKFGVNYTTAPF